jgi:hypothetical protein
VAALTAHATLGKKRCGVFVLGALDGRLHPAGVALQAAAPLILTS